MNLSADTKAIEMAAYVVDQAGFHADLAAGHTLNALRRLGEIIEQPELLDAVHDFSNAMSSRYMIDDKIANLLAALALDSAQRFEEVDLHLSNTAPAGPSGPDGAAGPAAAQTGANGPQGARHG